MKRTLLYIFLSWLSLCMSSVIVWGQTVQDTTMVVTTDTVTVSDSNRQTKTNHFKNNYSYLRLGIDLFQPAKSFFDPSIYDYKGIVEYSRKHSVIYAVEMGLGGCSFDSDHLNYTTYNPYFSVAILKALFEPFLKDDFDVVYVGVKCGVAPVSISDATYVVGSPFWGYQTAEREAFTKWYSWIDLQLGVRMELTKHWGLGWHAGAKFVLGGSQSADIVPYYVAGLGYGDKKTIMHYSLLATYTFKWMKREH
jgi:hypothetical protein